MCSTGVFCSVVVFVLVIFLGTLPLTLGTLLVICVGTLLLIIVIQNDSVQTFCLSHLYSLLV